MNRKGENEERFIGEFKGCDKGGEIQKLIHNQFVLTSGEGTHRLRHEVCRQ